MVTPNENRKILTNINRVERFDFARPEFVALRVNITSYGAAKYILTNPDNYKVVWEEGFRYLMGKGGSNFMLSGDDAAHAKQREIMHSLLYKPDWKASVRSFYAATAERLFAEKSYKLAGKTQIDVVRDVGNLAHTHFAARMFNLPLKSTENPRGVFSEQELYSILSVLFICIFFDIDPVKSFPLRQKAKEAMDQLGKVVETNVKLTKSLGIRGLYTGSAPKNDPLSLYGVNLIKGLSKAGLSAYDITWSQVLPTAGAMVPNQAQVVS
jgi:cytochrome P450